MPRTFSVGYFACAQYDVLFLHVILNAVKNPTEEPTRCILYSLWSWDISLALNMTFVWLSPSGKANEKVAFLGSTLNVGVFSSHSNIYFRTLFYS